MWSISVDDVMQGVWHSGFIWYRDNCHMQTPSHKKQGLWHGRREVSIHDLEVVGDNVSYIYST